VFVSIVVHAALLSLFIAEPKLYEWHPPALPTIEPTTIEIVALPTPVGGGGSVPRHVNVNVDVDVTVKLERVSTGSGGGVGDGIGLGTGTGIGFGTGGSVRIPDVVPPPPPPPPAPIAKLSKARPAKLIWPTRDEEVDNEANLFSARVIIDSHGDVIGARMLTVRPGAKADRAASAIWTFRYSPALDDDGHPVNSTLDQSFQVR
jgi:hypothetical protein